MDCFFSKDSCQSRSGNEEKHKYSKAGNGLAADWDYIILTASNEEQAKSYTKQIDYRIEAGILPKNIHYAVVPDKEGKRIGSGGALFNVLKYIRETSVEDDCFSDKRLLVIHSGGDSKRIPQYSVCGKLFSPVPRELSAGISSTLFDEIVSGVSDLPSKMQSGMLTLVGDILLVFDPAQVNLADCDAAAISVKENIQTGTNHGVFIPDKEGIVKKFLHKATLQELRSLGAEDDNHNVHLDTGAIWLSSHIIKELFNLISLQGRVDDKKYAEFVNEKARLSFYADFVCPMAKNSILEQFYCEKPEGEYTNELMHCRAKLWETLHKYRLQLIALSPATFVHIGTTSELLDMMTTDIKKYASLGWGNIVNTNIVAFGRYSVNSSFIDENTVIGDGSYIENSSLYNSKVGKRCIVSNITLDTVEVPDKTVIHCLKQKDGDYVVRIYGINDNPKQEYDDGGTILGIPLGIFMQRQGLTEKDLWDGRPYCLWDAKLYNKNSSLEQSLKYALSLCTNTNRIVKGIKRVSLKQSFENADINDILRQKMEIKSS